MIRLIRSLLGVKCPLCLERHRHLIGHLDYDHFGEVTK